MTYAYIVYGLLCNKNFYLARYLVLKIRGMGAQKETPFTLATPLTGSRLKVDEYCFWTKQNIDSL